MGRKVNTRHIDGMENLKPGEGVEGYEYGAELSTEGVPLIDAGEGKQVAIRVFTFKIDPTKLKTINKISKQTIFNEHAKQIATIMWGDGLRPYESAPPRVILDIKKGIYQIFVPCESAKGVIWSHKDKPKTLQELTKRDSKPKTK